MSRPVGPYTLVRALGEGSQGTVWEALHRHRDATVALKLLRPDVAPHFRRLEQEATALARLAHPSVVAVLDVGQVGPKHESDTLPAGTPWLAMELVRGARPLGPARDWREALVALLAMLDALAHCHARGVVHRDVKPGNVLTREGRVCLTDFGLAWLGKEGDARLRAGTPPYMSPEQFLGRATGPWTDLYALGCIAAYLVQGRPPFQGPTLSDLREQHLYQPPSTTPSLPVPNDFDGWLGGLLAKQPGDRFRSAAHAADALTSLGPPRTGPSATSESSVDELTWMTQLPHSVVLDPVHGPREADVMDRRALRPVPNSWRTAYPVALDDIHTSGFGLHALRDPPLVGREPERDRLWAWLQEVATTGKGRAVSLVGPQGSGRHTLARWLATRAAELAIATAEGPLAGPGPHIRTLEQPPDPVPEGLLALVPAHNPHPGTDALAVPRMSEGEVRRLLDHRVRLDPLLTARLAWRADGHPGKAVALLAMVVPHLVAGADGPTLPGEIPDAPAEADDAMLWGDRSTHFTHDPPTPDHPDPLRRCLALESEDAEGAAAALVEAMDRPHGALRFPVATVRTIDAVRAFVVRQSLPADGYLALRADMLEAWLLANLHLNERACAVAHRILSVDGAPSALHRDAHLILAKAYRIDGAERRLPHILAASRHPPHPVPSYRMRHWRLLIMALRQLDERDEIDALLARIADDEALTLWAGIELAHEARRRGEAVELDALIADCRSSDDPDIIKAMAGLAFSCGRLDEGESLLRGLLQTSHDSAVVRCNLGWILASQGRLDEVPDLITTVPEADGDVHSSLSLLKAFVHAADAQVDVEAYLDRFRPFLVSAPFVKQTCGLLDDLAQRAEDAGLVARAVLARRHAGWLRSRGRA